MKKILLVCSVMVFLAGKNFAQQNYRPAYQAQWHEVKDRIISTWHLSKVDPAVLGSRSVIKLPLPYMSIRQNRNVLFGWDTYFTNTGLLLIDSLAVYAKNATLNQLAEVEQIGYVPNASESWALNRAQPPFLSMMVREWYEKNPDKKWLGEVYDLLRKEYFFWTDTSANAIEDHRTTVPGLQRFYHHATKAELLTFYNQIAPRFGFAGDLPEDEKLKMGEAWITEAETGMDFTPRFENRCHQFIPLDLNANLYMFEKNFAWMVKELTLKNQPDWDKKAATRKALLTKYCWDEKRGMFMDYDFINKRFSKTPSVATFYPLWAGMATKEQAARVLKNLYRFEYDFGPTICEKMEHEHEYQWDYPAGWPPIYLLVTKGLHNYGYYTDAKRIAAKYLDVVAKNFARPQPETYNVRRGSEQTATRTPGFVYEKYDVTEGTIYDAEYPSRSFQGWSYGVYIWCLNYYEKQK